jgi:hypothetical protein
VKYEKATERSLADLNEAIATLNHMPEVVTPSLVAPIDEMLRKWARVGRFELDFLNKIGGREAVMLAREIAQLGKKES